MSELLPDPRTFRITQATGKTSARSFADLDHLIVLLPHSPAAADWKQVPEGERLRRLFRRHEGEERHVLRSHVGAGTAISLACAPRAADGAFALLGVAGELAADALARHPGTLGIVVAGKDERPVHALLLALGAAAFRMPEFRRKPAHAPRLRQVRILGLARKLDLARTLVETEAGNLVRWLTALPPNKLTATSYRQLIAGLAEHNDWSMRFLDVAALRHLGAGAFLAVAQASPETEPGIVHLSWRPDGRSQPDVALVGKGIIFDTGGTNLKPFRAMLDMHHDMCGSAVALGVLIAITRLKLPIAVDVWLAITENRIGPQGYKSRDVVVAADGTTIEVIHTDAEGRMALADALALAAREKPGLIVDYATLTGQCINALTDRYSGVFTNREPLEALLVAAGRESGERVWPFPMDADYDEELKSTVADVVQCSVDNEGDHIVAARFLRRFVPEATPWVHVDLASATRKKGLGHVPGGPTGFGVRLTLNLLVERAAGLTTALGRSRHGD
jgi:leucyl aminopeptidase